MEAATFAKAFLNLNKRNLLPGHMCSSLSFFLYFGVTFLMQLISALNEGAGTRGPGDMKVCHFNNQTLFHYPHSNLHIFMISIIFNVV